jgi:hypothetical protein
MTLKLRPTGLGSAINKDRTDYSVYSGELEVGRIYVQSEAAQFPPKRKVVASRRVAGKTSAVISFLST